MKKTACALILLLAICFSIAIVYLYGAWTHNRYWNGTIAKVQDTEIGLIKGILRIDLNKIVSKQESEPLVEIFKPLEGKLIVEIFVDSQLVFSNRVRDFRAKEEQSLIELARFNSRILFKIGKYEPPTWNSNFGKWILSFNKWFTPRFDYITMPFIFFLLIFIFGFLALIMWYKARHEQCLLQDILKGINEHVKK
ncbi:MAG: hypothetical protein Q8O10_09495 [candidate division Zixibacteria bacterium]|nr:hypothetical protein [candidate division Zixibacteria bacterium]